MEAGQSALGLMAGQAIGRQKFDVTIVWKDGSKLFFEDSIVHHMDGWVLVAQFVGDDWVSRSTHGLRGDDIKSYEVKARGL